MLCVETAAPTGVHLSPKRTQTRERLLQAALAVFAEHGVLGASVEAICERAGFTRGAFYSNFASKNELCAELLRQSIDRGVATAEAAVRRVTEELAGKTLQETIELGVAAFLELQPKGAEETLVRLELQLHAIRTPEARALYAAAYAGAEPLVAEMIEQALAAYGYRLSIPGTDAIALLHGAFNQAQVNALASGLVPTTELLAAPLIRLLNSLLVPLGD